jgi:hypothetical protein
MARTFDPAPHRLAAGWTIALAALLLTPFRAAGAACTLPLLDQSADKLLHAAFFGATCAFALRAPWPRAAGARPCLRDRLRGPWLL